MSLQKTMNWILMIVVLVTFVIALLVYYDVKLPDNKDTIPADEPNNEYQNNKSSPESYDVLSSIVPAGFGLITIGIGVIGIMYLLSYITAPEESNSDQGGSDESTDDETYDESKDCLYCDQHYEYEDSTANENTEFCSRRCELRFTRGKVNE